MVPAVFLPDIRHPLLNNEKCIIIIITVHLDYKIFVVKNLSPMTFSDEKIVRRSRL